MEELVVAQTGKCLSTIVCLPRLIGTSPQQLTFVALTPWTGRKHQLRVHCASVLKTPILGDDKYTKELADDINVRSFPLLPPSPLAYPCGSHQLMLGSSNTNKLHLHCRYIEMPHPAVRGKRLRVVAPPPQHMRQTMQVLQFSERDEQPKKRKG